MLRETSKRRFGGSGSGFTLVELLAAMAVFALLLGVGMQMISSTARTTNASAKRMETASMSRIALDRIERDVANAILNGGATMMYFGDSSNRSANSSIAWATKSRSRYSATADINTEVRGATVGYQVRNLPYRFGTTTAQIPTLQRGDGRLSYRRRNSGSYTDYMFARMFGANEIPADLSSGTSEAGLNFQGLGDGIVRFHISFLQDDGSIVQIPPSYANFDAMGGTGGCVPIAFTKTTSADPAGRHVKALVVGVAVLDEPTLRLSYEMNNKFTIAIASAIERPMQPEETPVAVWSANLVTNSAAVPRPVLQNLRFYQRLIPTNL